MERQLIIFQAFALIVLVGDAVCLWFLFRMIRQAARHFEQNRTWYEHLNRTLAMSVRAAETTSSRAAVVSGELRESLDALGDTLARTDNWARYGLAKLDFNAERASTTLGRKTRRAGSHLGEGLYKTAAAVQGVRATLRLVRRWQKGRRGQIIRHSLVPAPVDTVLTLLSAVTALGRLFSSRHGEDEDAIS